MADAIGREVPFPPLTAPGPPLTHATRRSYNIARAELDSVVACLPTQLPHKRRTSWNDPQSRFPGRCRAMHVA